MIPSRLPGRCSRGRRLRENAIRCVFRKNAACFRCSRRRQKRILPLLGTISAKRLGHAFRSSACTTANARRRRAVRTEAKHMSLTRRMDAAPRRPALPVCAGDADRTHRANNLCAPRRFVDPFRLAWIAQRVKRGQLVTGTKRRLVSVIETTLIGPSTALHVIKVGEQFFLVGNGASGFSFLTEVPADVAGAWLLAQASETTETPPLLQDFLRCSAGARTGGRKEMNGRFGREGTTVMAYGSSTESHASAPSENGIVAAPDRPKFAIKRAIVVLAIGALSAGVAFAVVRATLRRGPGDPTTHALPHSSTKPSDC